VPEQGAQDVTVSPPRVGFAFIAVYALALFGIWLAINLPASVTIALRVSQLAPLSADTTYSLVAGVGTLTAVIANPLFGRLSDRTRSRFGRRRPWIVVGLVGTTVGALVIGVSSTVPLLVLGWVLMQAFVNACVAGVVAIVADRVPEEQQGLVGALSGATLSASLVVGIFFIRAFPDDILAQIGLPVAVAIVVVLALVAMYREDTPASGPREPFSLREFFGSFFVSPRTAPNFTWVIVTMFLVSIGIGAVSTYTVYYLQYQLGVEGDDLTQALFLAYLVPGLLSVALAPLAGWAGDRLGRRKPFMALAAVAIGAGIAVMVAASGVEQFLVGIALVMGVGAGLMYGTYIALAVAAMDDRGNEARNLGVINIAITLPYSVVPLLAPVVLSLGGGSNYPLLFALCGAVTLLGVVPLRLVRNTR
jgi:MFS family permease